jgi:PAS domain S-box-containing protein
MDQLEVVGKIVAGVGTAAPIVYKFLWKPCIVHFKRVHDIWIKLEAITEEIARVNHELHRNSGLSIRDAVDRIEKLVSRGEERQKILMGLNPFVVFESDVEGQYTFVNKTFLRWTGREYHDVLGSGWFNCIFPEDRDKVREEWERAVEEKRTFEMRFRYQDRAGNGFSVFCRASPMFNEHEGRMFGYVGVARMDSGEPCAPDCINYQTRQEGK